MDDTSSSFSLLGGSLGVLDGGGNFLDDVKVTEVDVNGIGVDEMFLLANKDPFPNGVVPKKVLTLAAIFVDVIFGVCLDAGSIEVGVNDTVGTLGLTDDLAGNFESISLSSSSCSLSFPSSSFSNLRVTCGKEVEDEVVSIILVS